MARFVVTLTVDVDLDAWTSEYKTEHVGESLVQVLADLREPGYYMPQNRWTGLATVTEAKATLVL